jgi:hypothetical protein
MPDMSTGIVFSKTALQTSRYLFEDDDYDSDQLVEKISKW